MIGRFTRELLEQAHYRRTLYPPSLLFIIFDNISCLFLIYLFEIFIICIYDTSFSYLDQMSAWFEPGSVRELVGIKTFAQLQRSVGVYGICGLDRLLCFMIVKDLQGFTTVVRNQVEKHLKKDIINFENELHPTTQVPNPAEVNKMYLLMSLLICFMFCFIFLLYTLL